jgi:ceramide glucosyltransferase
VTAVATALAVLAICSIGYCALVLVASWRYRQVPRVALPAAWPRVSVLKPLAGVDEGLEDNLASFFAQAYPAFEILCAVGGANDPAVAVVERVRRAFPEVSSHLLVVGEPPYPSPKVHSIARLEAIATGDLLVISDSDVRVPPTLLHSLAAELSAPGVGLSTCASRVVPGRSVWARVEALGLNTEFVGGVLVARLIEGMRFALGPIMAVRREVVRQIGGLDVLGAYHADDFRLGQLVAAAGWQVCLSAAIVEHRIDAPGVRESLRHRLRWARSTRCSRPWGYVGQVFTYPVPVALLLWAVRPAWWPLAVAALVVRAAAAWATAGSVLHDPLTRRWWPLLPLQDVVSAACWIGGFFGRDMTWRGHRYRFLADGRVERIAAAMPE